MSKTFAKAISKIELLPEVDQEAIGRELLEHVERLRSLRSELQVGAMSLDARLGKEIDIEDVISRARDRDGGAN
jgi:hypothetical protein